jgi:hypothetical protein
MDISVPPAHNVDVAFREMKKAERRRQPTWTGIFAFINE